MGKVKIKNICMDEVFPQHENQVPAQSEGQSDVNAQDTPITVHEFGQESPQVDPSNEQSDDTSGQVEDVSKAWDMATASDESRTKAAMVRNRDDKEEVFRSLLAEPLPSRSIFPSKAGERAAAIEQRQVAEDAFKSATVPPFENQEFSGFKRSAEEYDAQAEAIETWAGILHDHPVSEAYLETRPDLDVTPEGLYRLEKEAQKDSDIAARIEYAVDQERNLQKIRAAIGADPEIKAALRLANEATANVYTAALDKVNEGLEEYYGAVKQLKIETRVKPLQNKAALINSLLEDIRSGRASA
jgi:hypothetical protein